MIALVHVAQQAVQRLGGLLVEIAGRLVGQKDGGPHDEGARHGHPLLFAARQHAGTVRQPLAETDAAQQFLRPGARLGQRHAGNPHRHLGVLQRAELRQQVMKLEDEPDVPVPKRHHVGVG